MLCQQPFLIAVAICSPWTPGLHGEAFSYATKLAFLSAYQSCLFSESSVENADAIQLSTV